MKRTKKDKILPVEIYDAEQLAKATHFIAHDYETGIKTDVPGIQQARKYVMEDSLGPRVVVYAYHYASWNSEFVEGQICLTPRTFEVFDLLNKTN